MLDIIPWRPVSAVTADLAAMFLGKLPRLARAWLLPIIGRRERLVSGVPVFIMLPLDVALDKPVLSRERLLDGLDALQNAGVEGVMFDIWWGLCEQEPGVYDFAAYSWLFEACKKIGFKVQATMSFHACGGNVGDTVNIPLPKWVVEAGDESGFWFKDREERVTREYISFGADHEPLLPGGEGGRNRTPLQAYGAFLRAFVEEMKKGGFMGNVISELQIGMGPCGELRYPSYRMEDDLWKFPGIGEFQCFDRFLLRDLADTIRAKGSEEVKNAKMPPEETGEYNSRPWDTKYFRKGFATESGRFFQHWYASKMLEHGEDVLKLVRSIVPLSENGIAVAVKVSGVHWWKFTAGRAAEAMAGYMMGGSVTAYGGIAKLLKMYGAVLDFTCLEMRTIDQPFLKARCGPRQLVWEVWGVAKREGVAVAGENALETFDWGAYMQIAGAFRNCRAKRYGFTLLRLGEGLLEEENMARLGRFVECMKRIG